MRQKLWRGLNARHWELVLTEAGWPEAAALLMATALVGGRQLPRWEELHSEAVPYEEFRERVLK